MSLCLPLRGPLPQEDTALVALSVKRQIGTWEFFRTFGFSLGEAFSDESFDKVGNRETYAGVTSSLIWFSTKGLWVS